MSGRGPRTTPEAAYDIEVLILSSADSRDDRILRVLTANDEVLPVVARGVRRPGRNTAKAAILQPLSEVTLRLTGRPNADLAVVEDAWLNEAHDAVKRDLVRLAHASVMTEAMLHLVPDHGAEDGLFALMTRALRRLGATEEEGAPQLCCLFLVRLLDLSGLLPDTSDEAESAGPNGYLPEGAGAVLADWRRGRWTTLPQPLVRPTLVWLERQVTAISMRPLKSQDFLDSVLSPSPPKRPASEPDRGSFSAADPGSFSRAESPSNQPEPSSKPDRGTFSEPSLEPDPRSFSEPSSES